MSIHKVQNVAAVADAVRYLQREGARVVFTNGCFDVLHAGHVDLFRRARALGDRVVVALNSDDSVRRLKGARRPVFPAEERAEIVAAMKDVDFVCIFNEDTPLETILAIRPDVLVKGADWSDRGIVGQTEVEGWGGRVVAVDLIAGHSTTGIVERVVQSSSQSNREGGQATSRRPDDMTGLPSSRIPSS
jgi:D-beta-D-heptose 7-phosphate kinase/D-beta-D-heptose 1-phosphate adenosyltransferase